MYRLAATQTATHATAIAPSKMSRIRTGEKVTRASGAARALAMIRVALTEEHGEGHVDVWASPDALLAAVTSVVQGFRRPYT